MPDTLVTADHPGLSALVTMAATADVAGDLLVSGNRLVDALLDVRGEVDAGVVPLVDEALRACAHRSVVPTAEVVELVATITAGQARPVDHA